MEEGIKKERVRGGLLCTGMYDKWLSAWALKIVQFAWMDPDPTLPPEGSLGVP